MNEIIKIVAFGLLIAYGTGILLFFVICSAVAQRAEIVNSGHGRLVDVSIKWLSIVLLSIFWPPAIGLPLLSRLRKL